MTPTHDGRVRLDWWHARMPGGTHVWKTRRRLEPMTPVWRGILARPSVRMAADTAGMEPR